MPSIAERILKQKEDDNMMFSAASLLAAQWSESIENNLEDQSCVFNFTDGSKLSFSVDNMEIKIL